MDYMQYSQDFQINSYFNSLPPYARQTILEAYGEITTLGELKKCADHIMNSGLYSLLTLSPCVFASVNKLQSGLACTQTALSRTGFHEGSKHRKLHW